MRSLHGRVDMRHFPSANPSLKRRSITLPIKQSIIRKSRSRTNIWNFYDCIISIMTNGMFCRIECNRAFALSGRIPDCHFSIPRAMPWANRSLAFQAVPAIDDCHFPRTMPWANRSLAFQAVPAIDDCHFPRAMPWVPWN